MRAIACVLLLGAVSAGTAAALPVPVHVTSRHGLYRVTVTPRPAASPVGRLHSWTIAIADRRGKPVRRARITVVGDMPAHGHGLPTTPRARETAPGRYLIEGMKFQMGGHWYVEFRIAAAPGNDTARVSFNLPG